MRGQRLTKEKQELLLEGVGDQVPAAMVEVELSAMLASEARPHRPPYSVKGIEEEKHCWLCVSVMSGIIYKTSSHTSPWDQVGCIKGGSAAPGIEKQRSVSWSAWRRASSLLPQRILHQRFAQVHFATEDTCAEQHDSPQSRRGSLGAFNAELVSQCPSCSSV